jgi:hypothetical protein
MSAPTPVLKGVNTIAWGPNGFLGTPNTAVVESGQVRPKNGKPVEIEDNNGFALTQVWIDDGFDATVRCLYDTAKTWPASQATVALSIFGLGVNGAAASFNCFVAALPEIDYARKRETMIIYSLTYRPGINT